MQINKPEIYDFRFYDFLIIYGFPAKKFAYQPFLYMDIIDNYLLQYDC